MRNNAVKVCEKLDKNGFKAFFVGGCVRDTILRQPIHDIDIATNAKPEDIQRIFPNHIDTGLKHGTVTVKMNKDFYEVTTFRIDGEYEDGRHPDEVIFVDDVIKDLARRDFTINAMAYDPVTDTMCDPFSGRLDIANKTISCVGSAKSRFMEDPLRVLRAMRFAIKLGFDINPATKLAMHDKEVLTHLQNCISKERITDELRKMLTCGKPIHDIFMEFADVVAVILPELAPCINAPHNSPWHRHDIYEHIICVVDFCDTTKFEIKLAALLHDIGKLNCRIVDENDSTVNHFKGHPAESVILAEKTFENDLKISNKEKELVLNLIKEHDREINVKPNLIRRFVSNYDLDFIHDWLILKAADIKDHVCAPGKEEKWNDLLNRFEQFKTNLATVELEESALKLSDLEVNGNDVIEILDIKPGPVVGKILNALFEDVLDEKLSNNREELLAAIKVKGEMK